MRGQNFSDSGVVVLALPADGAGAPQEFLYVVLMVLVTLRHACAFAARLPLTRRVARHKAALRMIHR